MDRYIVRVPRGQNSDSPSKSRQRLRQTTIESLRGVVVVEEVLRQKSILKVEGQSVSNLLAALNKLDSKMPSRDVLKSTKIGHTINSLTKHENKEVAELAATIVEKWKTFFQDKNDKPLIEVRCDRQTETMRKAGRKHLAAAMQVPEKNSLVEAIERETFHQHGRLINHSYRRSMRTLVFTLKHQPDVREKVLSKALEIKDFVAQYKKELKTL